MSAENVRADNVRADGPPARRRDAARSRELLLEAAGELFGERGFDRTTTREIGERAGVDPALIARYYGGKTQLYIAVMRAEQGDTTPADLLAPERLRELLARISRRGAGPVFRAAALPHDDPAVQDAARAQLHDRLVTPLREHFTREGLDRPQLRAEVAVAAFVGVVLARSGGAFDELAAAEPDELFELVRDLLDGTLPRG
ncbi:AcrR family transcriptional regulator [Kitasatospora sp. MAP12-15]|uniref:TetR/AcrR family transcriptional regulator n=1 Tax=unclassified Kitasatospora TaxID=2633591 RepID=UPI002476430D|nr:helix-turn-helix domain-containing protein [Kitasatospora sp. MAP12-44]MDH6113835.1 AcrR family transcriptional regulator [Kitasatospora sp. MAP12-44]